MCIWSKPLDKLNHTYRTRYRQLCSFLLNSRWHVTSLYACMPYSINSCNVTWNIFKDIILPILCVFLLIRQNRIISVSSCNSNNFWNELHNIKHNNDVYTLIILTIYSYKNCYYHVKTHRSSIRNNKFSIVKAAIWSSAPQLRRILIK